MNTRTRAARIKRACFEAVPTRWQLPVRYHYLRVAGSLEPEIHELRSIVRPGLTVDVGANYGIYTYALAKLGHRVLAIEPQPWCASAIRAWGRSAVDVLEVGLSDERGTAELHLPIINGVRSTGYASIDHSQAVGDPITIEVMRLDDLDLPDVSFIKVDVEGHELKVLRGAENTLRRWRPDLLIEVAEVNMTTNTVSDVLDWLAGLKYRGEFLLDSQWHPVEQFSIERHQRAYAAGDRRAPSVNNFLFRPAGA